MFKVPSDEKTHRVFLRVPFDVPARIFAQDALWAQVTLYDLSSTGFSFLTDNPDTVPRSFVVCFRFPRSFRGMKLAAAVKNTAASKGRFRVGCAFLDMPKRAQKRLIKYVSSYLSFSPSIRIFGAAAFLLLIDSLWRIIILFASVYYKNIISVKTDMSAALPLLYAVVLIIYASLSAAAFYCVNNVTEKRFYAGVYCAAPAFLFLLVKCAFYAKARLWESPFAFVRIFFWSELLLLLCVGAALIMLMGKFKKIRYFIKSAREYTRYNDTGQTAN